MPGACSEFGSSWGFNFKSLRLPGLGGDGGGLFFGGGEVTEAVLGVGVIGVDGESFFEAVTGWGELLLVELAVAEV
ncbi:MAG: hypothetical protein RI897_2167 [Verrucomicrobiota bacterium]